MADQLTPEKIKKLISDPKNKIQLHDLVHKETERIYKLVQGMSPNNREDAAKHAKGWMEQIEKETKTLRDIFAYGCYFGSEELAYIWTKSLNRLGTLAHTNGLDVMIKLQLYPAMLVLYAGGVSATAVGNAVNLKALFDAAYKDPHHDPGLLAYKTNGWLLDQNLANQILELERRKTPLSDHVFEVIEAGFPESLVVKDDFPLEYDKWEVILGMVVSHHLKDRSSGPWAPVGRFVWRHEDNGQTGLKVVLEDIEVGKNNWPPLTVQLFNGSLDDAKEAHKHISSIASERFF